MRMPSLHRLPILLMTLLLAGCAGSGSQRPTTDTGPRPPLVFAVSAVEVVDNSSLPPRTSFIDKRRSGELAKKLALLLRQRIQAGGGPGRLRAVIEKAVLVERPVKKTSGIAGFFLREAEARLEGSVTVRLSVLDEGGFQRAFARVKVERSRPVLEGTSVTGRDALARSLIEDLLAQFQDSLERSVEDNLAAFLTL